MSLKDQHSGQIIRRREDYTISRQLPKLFSPYSNTQDEGEDGILSYMARVHSPVRVTFTPAASLKQKSRVANQSLTTMFKIRPIKGGDRINLSRFKPPDSTLPSFQYISPWISITKDDNSGQRRPQDGQDSMFASSRASTRASSSLPRSVTDLDFNDAEYQPSNASEYSESFGGNHSQSRPKRSDIRSVSAKTQTSDRRVTFSEKATDSRSANGLESRNLNSPRREDYPKAVRRADGQIYKPVGNETESYNAYLPPGLSEQVVYKMNFGHYDQHPVNGDKSYALLVKDGLYYKPMIGDRSLFVRESYPTKPIVYQSDIDQLRFEGHERLMKSAGQIQSHFSMFKDRGSLIRPKDKGMYLEEALKRHRRLSKAADNNKMKRNKTSTEIF